MSLPLSTLQWRTRFNHMACRISRSFFLQSSCRLSYVRVCLWSEVYCIVALIADQLTCFNYGFLLQTPEAFSIFNFLSDSRPLYLLELHGVALLCFLGLYAPFAIIDLVSKKEL